MQSKDSSYWIKQAAVAAVLAKAYESQGLTWLAQRYAAEAVYCTAQGFACLAIELTAVSAPSPATN